MEATTLEAMWKGGKAGSLSPQMQALAWGMHEAGIDARDIAQQVTKVGGGHPSRQAVEKLVARIAADPEGWYPGQRPEASYGPLPVLRGAKRVVMIDPSASTFRCRRPKGNPHACWSGVDVLGQPPPNIPGLSEHILRDGEALIIPEMHWHSVENLEPTIAVGLNEINDCTGARFAKLRDPGAWFF